MKNFLTFSFCIFFSLSVFSQAAVYSFAGQPGNQASTAATSFLPGWTASAITRGAGIAGSAAANSMASNGFVIGATAIVADEYYEFTITTPTTGGPHNIAGVTFDFRASSTGPQSYSVRTSVNGATETQVASGSAIPNTIPGLVVTIPAELAIANSTTYRVRVYPFGASASGGTFRFQSTLTVLPTTLTGFDADLLGSKIALRFTTASESDNSHFEIERSTDGRTFNKVGEIKGAGTTSQEQRYSFVDEAPVKGTNYYRLKQVNFDGSFEFSKVVTARFGRSSSISVIPTLVYDQINVNLDAQSEEAGQWQIFDLSGREVLNGQIEAEQAGFSADLSNLTEGIYMVRVQMGTETYTERVQKL
jgi:Secretion system C-terminal sorting domain